MIRKPHTLAACVAAAVGLIGPASAETEIFTYTDGNLILGIQATGGTGSNKNVFFDLGKATDFRDNGNRGTLGNIGATLTATYGADWYQRADLFFGVIGNLNLQPASGIGSRAPVDGDPSRTFYLSQPAASPGAGNLYAPNTLAPGSLGTAGNYLSGLEKVLMPSTDGTGWNFSSADPLVRGLQQEADGAAVLDQSLNQHATAWNNGWTKWNPTPGASFGVFTGGIQQSFGKGGSATYVDVQRILATNTGASPTGVVGGGTYETTIAISSTGEISAIAAAVPTSSYSAWIDKFNPPLTNTADRAEDADPDQDGVSNLMEFVLDGDPAVPGSVVLPTLDASGANFVFAFVRRADSAEEVTQVVEFSTDLADWNTRTPVAVPATPGDYGVVVVSPSTGPAPDQVQNVTITVPKGSNPALFGRLKVGK